MCYNLYWRGFILTFTEFAKLKTSPKFPTIRYCIIHDFQELKREDKVVVLLIGNKTDLSPREVEITDGQKLATVIITLSP